MSAKHVAGTVAAVGALLAIAGEDWGAVLLVAGIGYLLWIRRVRSDPRSTVDARHVAAARNIAGTWDEVSTACGLGIKRTVSRREWVPSTGTLSSMVGIGGQWNDRSPAAVLSPLRLVRLRSLADGLALDLHTPAGVSPVDVERTAPAIAHHYRARGWELGECAEGVALVLKDGSDPLEQAITPGQLSGAPSLEDGCPVAVDRIGRTVEVPVLESNVLIGGIPKSGKSGLQTILLVGLAQIPNLALIGLDPKRVELTPWAARFSLVETQVSAMAPLLRKILDEIDQRYEVLQTNQRKKWLPDDGPILALVVDELAQVTSSGDKKADAERADLLRQIVAVGRAAGVFVSLATQKPSSDVVPTGLRDLITQRIAMRCTTREQAQTVLGGVPPEVLETVTSIPHGQSGVGVFTTESGDVVRARAAWVPDEKVPSVSAALQHLRVDLPWLSDEAKEK
ncbi:FtsK/SpoIIIE family protein [Brevibacterium sp. Mu109]|uniref:FtsK/SpoIIIE domain-containing protein n=1 Tax=Brevibacterium sp. Mu109 TaxID=1255669 RepID=UPI000C51DE3B|nr:FtsK/SpoIIIE domain-containing protein [Brevibacterium sp. Mu109]SMY00823.1 FtsK/SpoIIIE family protein [Brevibacterium sp. Mu109]